MIPAPKTEYKHTGSSVKDIQMGVNAEGLVHIMDILTKQYSDIPLAVIREYSTNAYDSNVEAGNGHLPIRVTLPTAFNPTFIVEDDGIGMSLNDIEAVYSQYGYSTKQHSNDFNGMLGIGSKSALGYTDQFTVDAVKDGWRTVATVTKDARGAGVIKVLSHDATTDSNGVRISIPVHDTDHFCRKAEDFFDAWTTPVEVNGEIIDGRKGWTDAGGGVFYRLGDYYARSKVVMANVAYPVDQYRYSTNQIAVMVEVPTGAVSFTPSRESLMYDEQTVDYLDANFEKWVAKATEHALESIITAPTPWEALVAAKDYWFLLNNKKIEYKGVVFPNYGYVEAENGWVLRPNKSRGKVSKHGSIDGRRTNVVRVTGFTNVDCPTPTCNKIAAWLANEGVNVDTIYLVEDGKDANFWSDGMATYDWADIKAWKMPRNKTASYSLGLKRVGNYGENTVKMTEQEIDDLDDRHVVLPVTIDGDTYDKRIYFRTMKELFGTTKDDYVMIGRNRFDKYMRENDEAIMLDEYITEKIKDLLDGLTEAEKFYYNHRRSDVSFWPNDTDDELFNQIAESEPSARQVDLNDQINTLRKAIRYTDLKIDIPTKVGSEWSDYVKESLPMVLFVDRFTDNSTGLIRDYVNLVAGS